MTTLDAARAADPFDVSRNLSVEVHRGGQVHYDGSPDPVGAPGWVRVRLTGGWVRVRLSGELDTATVAVLRPVLDGLHARGDRFLAVDVAGLRFLGTAGLGEFCRSADRCRDAGGRFILTGLTPAVRRLLDLTGYAAALTGPGPPPAPPGPSPVPATEGRPGDDTPPPNTAGRDGPRGGLTCGRLEPEHALLVARGGIDDTVIAEFSDQVSALVADGLRFLVLDFSQVSSCDPGLVPAMAQASRIVRARHGWVRMVATAPCVTATLDLATPGDLFTVYQAGGQVHDAT